jgi:tartrate dehydratase beta subunit/fumarate hydratase class I family protein
VQVLQAIASGQTAQAITMLQSTCPQLLEQAPKLVFSLRRQHLLELIAAGNADAALDYATKELADLAQTDAALLAQLEEAVMTLAVSHAAPDTTAALADQRHQVLAQVNSAIMVAQSGTTISTTQSAAASSSAVPTDLAGVLELLAKTQKHVHHSHRADFPMIEGLTQ